MTRARAAGLVVGLLLLAVFLLTRDGSGCRTPDDGDDDMEPACKPGDKECLGAAPPRDPAS